MLIKNNAANEKMFGNPSVPDQGFLLKPGINEVNDKAWEEFAGSKSVKFYLKSKELEIVKVEVEHEPKKEGDPKPPNSIVPVDAEDFNELNADSCIALVEECFEIEMLRKWEEMEKDDKDRITVLRAIDEQIDMLEKEVVGNEDE